MRGACAGFVGFGAARLAALRRTLAAGFAFAFVTARFAAFFGRSFSSRRTIFASCFSSLRCFFSSFLRSRRCFFVPLFALVVMAARRFGLIP